MGRTQLETSPFNFHIAPGPIAGWAGTPNAWTPPVVPHGYLLNSRRKCCGRGRGRWRVADRIAHIRVERDDAGAWIIG